MLGQDLEQWLREAGATITVPFKDCNQGYAYLKDEFQFRWTEKHVQVGEFGSFDRWANSIDWVLESLPDSPEAFETFLSLLRQLREAKEFDPGAGRETILNLGH